MFLFYNIYKEKTFKIEIEAEWLLQLIHDSKIGKNHLNSALNFLKFSFLSILPASDKHTFLCLLSKQIYSFLLLVLNYPSKPWKKIVFKRTSINCFFFKVSFKTTKIFLLEPLKNKEFELTIKDCFFSSSNEISYSSKSQK